MNQKHIVIVLGMHRSGTSAITRGLQVLGVELGNHLMPAAEGNNAKGFWEDMDAHALNEDIFKALGRSWHSWTPITSRDLQLPGIERLKLRAVELLREKLHNTDCFGLKDPRISLTLPFWESVFSHLEVRTSYIVACRHPMSVAQSLAKRDGLATEKAYHLWLIHTLGSLSGNQADARVAVDYDLLMNQPTIQLQRIADALGLGFDEESQAYAEYSEDFLEEDLRHNRYAPSDLKLDNAIADHAVDLYNRLHSVASDQTSFDAQPLTSLLERIRENLRQNLPTLRHVDRCELLIAAQESNNLKKDKEIELLRTSISEQNEHKNKLEQTILDNARTLAEQAAHIERVSQKILDLDKLLLDQEKTVKLQNNKISDLESVFKTRSWRITRPLRMAGTFLRKLRNATLRVLHVVNRHGLKKTLCRGAQILRNEGPLGVISRLRQQNIPSAFRLPNTINGFKLSPATISQNKQGHYELTTARSAYCYIPPEPPTDLPTAISSITTQPKFSIVVPVYNTDPVLLSKLLASVHGQWYPHWELILADDCSPSEETQAALSRINSPGIKILRLEQNQGISGATNAAIEAASGDFIVFLDHDDELTLDCLYELALCIERDAPDFIYSDEDKLAEDGSYTQPHFKPDWSPDTMMSTMFTCHVSCVRTSLLDRTGLLRSQFDGCQDWDFVLRVAEHTQRISHIPKVLYHWRIIPASIAADIAAKPYVQEASRQVRMDALKRRGTMGEVEELPQMQGYFRVNYFPQTGSLVSIIIPSRDNGEVLQRCLDSIRSKTRDLDYELIILDNGSIDPKTVAYLESQRCEAATQVIRHDAPFNFSELNNIGARAAKGGILLFLNDDTQVLQEDWLRRLAGFAQQPHIGAVGAKLLYPGGQMIQHAGVLNLADGPMHAFLRQPRDTPGYYMRSLLEYNWLAVTGACLMMETHKFWEIGGFDEAFPVAYNDIELCMSAASNGYYNVVCQAVQLIHHESISRGVDHIDPVKLERLQGERHRLYAKHPAFYQHDPFHNPNLHPNGFNFEIPN